VKLATLAEHFVLHKVVLAALCFGIGAVCETVTGVVVASVEQDRDTHQLTIRVQNRTSNPVSAFRLALIGTRPDGSTVTVFYEADNILASNKVVIPPWSTSLQSAGLPSEASAVTAEVIAVIFADNSADGDPLAVESMFKRRQNWSDGLRQGADALMQAVRATDASRTAGGIARSVRAQRSDAQKPGRLRSVDEIDRDSMIDDVAGRFESASSTGDLEATAASVAADSKAIAEMLSSNSKREEHQQ
jgi:hypothetical protein